jgi:hypothetical protein
MGAAEHPKEFTMGGGCLASARLIAFGFAFASVCAWHGLADVAFGFALAGIRLWRETRGQNTQRNRCARHQFN